MKLKNIKEFWKCLFVGLFPLIYGLIFCVAVMENIWYLTFISGLAANMSSILIAKKLYDVKMEKRN